VIAMRCAAALRLPIALVLLAAGSAGARKREDPTALVSVTIKCATPGATVFIDGEAAGMTPLDLPVPVSPGDHTVKVTKLGFAPYIDVFSTKGKRGASIEMELVPVSGVLHVGTNVPGARVLVDGKYVGDAPIDVEVDVGPRKVQLQKGGYREFVRSVTTVAGQDQEIQAQLEELPPEINPYKPKPEQPLRWYQKKWVWGTVAGGAAIVAGSVTAAAIVSTRQYNVCDYADAGACYSPVTQ
jgi:hypothetical protein